MNLMDHIRSIGGSRSRFDRIIELGNFDKGESFCDLPRDERLRRGALLADDWEAIAEECERSRATRFLFSSWTPEQMRFEAAEYRAGRDPHA